MRARAIARDRTRCCDDDANDDDARGTTEHDADRIITIRSHGVDRARSVVAVIDIIVARRGVMRNTRIRNCAWASRALARAELCRAARSTRMRVENPSTSEGLGAWS
jgi:hypothetical protein